MLSLGIRANNPTRAGLGSGALSSFASIDQSSAGIRVSLECPTGSPVTATMVKNDVEFAREWHRTQRNMWGCVSGVTPQKKEEKGQQPSAQIPTCLPETSPALVNGALPVGVAGAFAAQQHPRSPPKPPKGKRRAVGRHRDGSRVGST